jgi:hypothetical protein
MARWVLHVGWRKCDAIVLRWFFVVSDFFFLYGTGLATSPDSRPSTVFLEVQFFMARVK